MRHMNFLTMFISVIPLAGFSQPEVNDSISFGQNRSEGMSMEGVVQADSLSEMQYGIVSQFSYAPSLNPLLSYKFLQPSDLHVPIFRFTPGHASIFDWKSGAIEATGNTRSFPGLMQIDSGELGIYQSAGNFSFHAGGVVNKYGYFNGLHTQYGFNGSISYQFLPKYSVTFFGEYYFGQPPRMANGLPMPPAMIGFYARSTFGGYFDYRLNDRWGVQTGVQTVQQVGSNRYKAEPIVTPYYRISKKVAIGLPVGQILYHIIKK